MAVDQHEHDLESLIVMVERPVVSRNDILINVFD